jgi:hypothetical protein
VGVVNKSNVITEERINKMVEDLEMVVEQIHLINATLDKTGSIGGE